MLIDRVSYHSSDIISAQLCVQRRYLLSGTVLSGELNLIATDGDLK